MAGAPLEIDAVYGDKGKKGKHVKIFPKNFCRQKSKNIPKKSYPKKKQKIKRKTWKNIKIIKMPTSYAVHGVLLY